MDAGNSLPVNKPAHKNLALASVQGGEKQRDVSPQGQMSDAPVTGSRGNNTAGLLSAASQPADRVAMTDGSPTTTSVTATHPMITTTTATTAITTTVTSTTTTTTTTATQPRIVLLHQEGDVLPPVWEHYAVCALQVHSAVFNDTCGSKLVSQVARIPCTTDFYPADDAFVDGFIEVVKGTFASDEGMANLESEQQSWIACQANASSAQQEKLSVWIRLFGYALMVAKALTKEDAQAGLQDPTGKLRKLRNPIDGMRRNLVRIHLGDTPGHDNNRVTKQGNASGGPKAHSTSHAHRRAGSMTALFALSSSPVSGKKALPRLPGEDLAAFDSKEKALLAWKTKADKRFEKHHVDRALLRFFEQSLGAVMRDRPDFYCIAYKFVASVLFAESTRGIAPGEALVEATDNELGYVNEILAFREKLKAVVRPDSGAQPEERRYCQMWLDFFQHVGVLMDFRRGNRETALSESLEMTKTLASCEIAYDTLVKTMREVDDLRQKQDEDARARHKAARAKERRLKGRSMDFLMPSKEKRAAQSSGTQDTDAIGLSPRKKIAKQDKQRENIPDDALLATSQPTSQRGVARPKKKSATSEVTQQEAGPVRAAEKKKAKPRETRREQERNADAPTIGEGKKPKKEKEEKKPGKASKGNKED